MGFDPIEDDIQCMNMADSLKDLSRNHTDERLDAALAEIDRLARATRTEGGAS